MIPGLPPDGHSLWHILYIEDNPANQKLVGRVLSHRPATCVTLADDAATGLAAIARQRPHLLLLDINLPDRDGFAVFSELRADAALPYFPIVAVSANAMVADIEKARALGFDDYIVKPFDLLEFKQVIDRFLPV